MGRIVNFIEIILDYLPEACLMVVIAFSFLPFALSPHSYKFYTIIGALLTFCSTVIAPEYHSKGSVLYNSLLAIIVMLGVVISFSVGWKFELCAATYYGSIAGALCGFVFRKFKY